MFKQKEKGGRRKKRRRRRRRRNRLKRINTMENKKQEKVAVVSCKISTTLLWFINTIISVLDTTDTDINS